MNHATVERLDRINPTSTLAAPSRAFRMDAAEMKFAVGDSENVKNVAIKARTGDVMDHWYYGRMVHDFAGMRRKEQVAIDWCHDPDELIGVLTKFNTVTDLVCTGTIVSLKPDDQAAKIFKWQEHGIPLEASIDWSDMCVMEWLPEGFQTEVNGRTIAGPTTIVREWSLRRVAICPSGADRTSQTKIESQADGAREVSLHWKGSQHMSAIPATNPAADVQPPKTVAPAPATPATQDARAQFNAQLKKWTDKFGPEDGLAYFSQDLSWEASLEKHLDKMTTTKLAADKSAAESAQKLAAINLGEQQGIATVGTAGAQPKTFSACMEGAREKARAAAK